MDARSLRRAALAAILVAACGPGERSRTARDDDDGRRRAGPPGPAIRVIDADAPIDVRLLRLEPELHVGSERVCDVAIAGATETITARSAGRYPRPVAERRLVRCASATGDGWADLVFPPAAASLVGSVAPGKRIRVEVVAPAGGFEDAPILEFLTVIGDAPVTEGSDDGFRSVEAGFDFGRLERGADLDGEDRTCAVAYVGPFEPIAEDELARYPLGATHRADLACKHARGDAWVDFVFDAQRADEVLALRRGARPSLRIFAPSGGVADLPIVGLSPRPPEAAREE